MGTSIHDAIRGNSPRNPPKRESSFTLDQHSIGGRDTYVRVDPIKIELPPKNGNLAAWCNAIRNICVSAPLTTIMQKVGSIFPKFTADDFTVAEVINNLLKNAVIYGMLGLGPNQQALKNMLFSHSEDEPPLTPEMCKILNSCQTRNRFLRISALATPDYCKISIQDSGKFPNFPEKWAEARRMASDPTQDDAGHGLLVLARLKPPPKVDFDAALGQITIRIEIGRLDGRPKD